MKSSQEFYKTPNDDDDDDDENNNNNNCECNNDKKS